MGLRKINWRLLVAILYWMWGLFARGGYPILQLRERMSPLGYPISCGHTHTTASSCGDHTHGDTKIQIHPKRDTDTNMASSSWSSAFFYDFRSGKTCFSLHLIQLWSCVSFGIQSHDRRVHAPNLWKQLLWLQQWFRFWVRFASVREGSLYRYMDTPMGPLWHVFRGSCECQQLLFHFCSRSGKFLRGNWLHQITFNCQIVFDLLGRRTAFYWVEIFKTVPDGLNYNRNKY